jgi:hypothetical protein
MVRAKSTKSIVRSHQFAQSQYAELGVTGNCAGLILFVALSPGALTKTLAVHRACKQSSADLSLNPINFNQFNLLF